MERGFVLLFPGEVAIAVRHFVIDQSLVIRHWRASVLKIILANAGIPLCTYRQAWQ